MTNSSRPFDDVVQPFQLESSQLRGRLVRLGNTLDVILGQHAYPPAVGNLLGETMVITAALGTALKFDGLFTLQIKSDGALKLLVADVTSDGGVRAYAQQRAAEEVTPGMPLLGKGFLAFTVDQKMKEDRYQGIVALEGNNLSEAVQHYFRQSEQIPTGILAAVRQDEQGHWHGGCLMLQRMPREGGISNDNTPPEGEVSTPEEDWQRAMVLMQTCSAEELTNPFLTPEKLLTRLFHEEGVRVYEPLTFRHQCRCSVERVEGMLRCLPREEVEEMAIDGVVSVTCEFCNRSYIFNSEQRKKLYSAEPAE